MPPARCTRPGCARPPRRARRRAARPHRGSPGWSRTSTSWLLWVALSSSASAWSSRWAMSRSDAASASSTSSQDGWSSQALPMPGFCEPWPGKVKAIIDGELSGGRGQAGWARGVRRRWRCRLDRRGGAEVSSAAQLDAVHVPWRGPYAVALLEGSLVPVQHHGRMPATPATTTPTTARRRPRRTQRDEPGPAATGSAGHGGRLDHPARPPIEGWRRGFDFVAGFGDWAFRHCGGSLEGAGWR